MDQTNLILIGAIAGAHGVRGDVRLMSFAANPEDIAAYGPLTSEDGRTFTIESLKPLSKGFSARLAEVRGRADAEALKSTRLYCPRSALPAADEDEFYHADLIGLEVQTLSGEPAGRIVGVHDFGAGDLLEIAPNGGKTIFVPFTQEAVPVVDIKAGRVW